MSSVPFGMVTGTFRSFINSSDMFLYFVLILCVVAIALSITKLTGKSLDENLEMVKEGLDSRTESVEPDSKQYYEKFKNFFGF
jgi:hypothetical protein